MDAKNYEFRENGWSPSEFRYTYSPACRTYPEFGQESRCIVNRPAPDGGAYEYISMVTKKEYAPGSVFSARCSFEHYGAPLIVLADGLREGPDGIARYKDHFEIVAYEGGVNVWHIEPEGGGVRPENLTRQKFSVPPKTAVLLTVKTSRDGLSVCLQDTRFTLPVRLPERFYAGITACEGIDRFYEFTARERTV